MKCKYKLYKIELYYNRKFEIRKEKGVELPIYIFLTIYQSTFLLFIVAASH